MTDKMRVFVDEYLADLNATAAAIRAGYSKHTASVKGSQLLSHPDIQEALTAAFKARTERTRVNESDVIHGLMTEAKGADEGNARVKAWEVLGRFLGMFREADAPPMPKVILGRALTAEEWQAEFGDNERDPNLQ